VSPQVVEIFRECLDSVEAVFAQGKCARGSGCPRVYESHLHDIERLFGIADKRAAIGDMNVYVGTFVEVICILRVAIAHDGVGDDRIDFYYGDAWAAVRNGPQLCDATYLTD